MSIQTSKNSVALITSSLAAGAAAAAAHVIIEPKVRGCNSILSQPTSLKVVRVVATALTTTVVTYFSQQDNPLAAGLSFLGGAVLESCLYKTNDIADTRELAGLRASAQRMS